jgi:ABC-type antimicrobial peptide transport system permease subunit
LFGVPSWDPISLAMAMGGLVFVGVIASGVPALRASRLDPMVALREE